MSRTLSGIRSWDRSGGAVRSIVLLLAVILVVIAALRWTLRTQKTDFTNGGLLFPVEPAQIEGLLLTRQGLQYRFDRFEGGGWSLSGAANDYLNPQAMAALVNLLPTVVGGAILPGTETEDRRYDFNGQEAIRLRVFLAGGEDLMVALGTRNPVTGNYFASHAGRAGCFPVAAPFRDKLFMLPLTVQANKLLPKFERDQVQQVRLTRGGREHLFARRDGHWWLQLPGEDMAEALRGLPGTLADYQAQCDDRRRQDSEGMWIMASSQAMGQLIYEVSDIIVRDIKSPRESAERLQQWELDPPWRKIILQGEGINSDPSAPVTDQFTLAFGTQVADDRVPVLRRDNVMLTDFEAVNLLDQDLGALIENMALNDVAMRADGLRLEREGVLLLDARRTGESNTIEGRTAWQTVVPKSGQSRLSDDDRHGVSQDLVVNLNRIEILGVLPPVLEPTVLEQRERVRITLSWGTGAIPRQVVFEIGYLSAAQTAAGREALARTPDGETPVGMWFPATGKLLQVPKQLIVTARSLATMMRTESSP